MWLIGCSFSKHFLQSSWGEKNQLGKLRGVWIEKNSPICINLKHVHSTESSNDDNVFSMTQLYDYNLNNAYRSLLWFGWGFIWESGADPGFGQGGPQLLRPKVADVAELSCTNEASYLRWGSRARLIVLEAFGFSMLKYAFSHILETLFLYFFWHLLQHQKLIEIEH